MPTQISVTRSWLAESVVPRSSSCITGEASGARIKPCVIKLTSHHSDKQDVGMLHLTVDRDTIHGDLSPDSRYGATM